MKLPKGVIVRKGGKTYRKEMPDKLMDDSIQKAIDKSGKKFKIKKPEFIPPVENKEGKKNK